jgi:hypothetical protein
MTAVELREWVAFTEVEPWGDVRADYRAGILPSVMANVMGGNKKTPADYMPFVTFGAKEETPQQLADRFTREFFKATKHLSKQIVRR